MICITKGGMILPSNNDANDVKAKEKEKKQAKKKAELEPRKKERHRDRKNKGKPDWARKKSEGKQKSGSQSE